MKLIKPFATVLATLALSGMAIPSSAYDGDWKRGRIYYRSVCTSCHVALPIGQVNPSSKTMAEWKSYLQADKHAKGKDTVKQLPLPGLLCARIVPPCAATILWALVSPMPVPPVRRSRD